jgi:hypothetical protein
MLPQPAGEQSQEGLWMRTKKEEILFVEVCVDENA